MIRTEVLRGGIQSDLNMKIKGTPDETLAAIMTIQDSIFHSVILSTSAPGATTVPMSLVNCGAEDSFNLNDTAVMLAGVCTTLDDVEFQVKAGASS